MNRLIYLLAFSSGFCIMTIELLGGRILAPYFGGGIYVWGSIITVFMLALSLGYLAGGRWSLENASLKRYGLLFLLSALATLPIVFGAEPVMLQVFTYIEDPRYGSLMASMLLFFIPTIILGMIAPYSVKLLVRSTASSGQTAGNLYFVSTIGSALGTLATSFYLVKDFEINQILLSVIFALAVGGLLAITMNKKLS